MCGNRKKAHDSAGGNFVVERLAVEVDEGGVHLDVVSAPWTEGSDLTEYSDGVSSAGSCDVRLLDDVITECLGRVLLPSQFRYRDVETHLGQIHWGVVIQTELESDLGDEG